MQQPSQTTTAAMPRIGKALAIGAFGVATFALATQGLFASSQPAQEPALVQTPAVMLATHDASAPADRWLEDRMQIEMSVAAYDR
jgi:hypothetical protein